MDCNGRTLDFAADLLYGFDIKDDESLDFLRSLIVSGHVPEPELKEIFELGLLRGKEEWDMIWDCALATRDQSVRVNRSDPGLIPSLACVLAGQPPGHGVTVAKKENKKRQRRSESRKGTSTFWEDRETERKRLDAAAGERREVQSNFGPSTSLPLRQTRYNAREEPSPTTPALSLPDSDTHALLEIVPDTPPSTRTRKQTSSAPPAAPTPLPAHNHIPTLRHQRSVKSPFFPPPESPRKPRPPRGTISRLPFPPLSTSRFGLVQESLTHDSFRLLVAVTFLIRTTGRAAVPVFYRVMDKFPTPAAFAEADLETELVPMIAHLGLPAVRCAAIARYARGWRERPPEREVTYVVRGYPGLGGGGVEDLNAVDDGAEEPEERHEDSGSRGAEQVTPENAKSGKKARRKLASSEWEIGHLTQGRYAIDSWRIFCRDIFLGKSDNWMGPPCQPALADEDANSFEPEWKRVLPQDKELRACLRWMWMREGFEWDPVTGERSPLREEMRIAVEEGRVKYDNKGELVILEQTSESADVG